MASSLETGLPPIPPLFVRFPGCWPCWRWHTVKGAIMDDAKDSKARLTRRSFLGLGATAAVVAAGAGLAACSPTAAAESASGVAGGSAAASGAASWRTPPSAPDDVAEEAQCDVLVIGLGHAGSCAARAAAEAGAVVYAFEQQEQDARSYMSGGQVGHINRSCSRARAFPKWTNSCS